MCVERITFAKHTCFPIRQCPSAPDFSGRMSAGTCKRLSGLMAAAPVTSWSNLWHDSCVLPEDCRVHSCTEVVDLGVICRALCLCLLLARRGPAKINWLCKAFLKLGLYYAKDA